MVGYIRDAQNGLRDAQKMLPSIPQAQWDVANVLTISHLMGAPRTEKIVDTESMKISAKAIYDAIQQAITEDSTTVQKNVVIMGASAGGAVAMELAALMKDQLQQLILEEPAGMTEQKHMTRGFILSSARPAWARAREKNMNFIQALHEIAEETRISWTQPNGTPETIKDMITPFFNPPESIGAEQLKQNLNEVRQEIFHIRNFADLKKLLRQVLTPAPAKYMSRENVYGLPKNGSGLNVGPLAIDSTKSAREDIEVPTMFIFSESAKVTNPRNSFGRKVPAAEIMAKLFPKSRVRNVLEVPGNDHSGLGRRKEIWQKIIQTTQQIPLDEKVAA